MSWIDDGFEKLHDLKTAKEATEKNAALVSQNAEDVLAQLWEQLKVALAQAEAKGLRTFLNGTPLKR